MIKDYKMALSYLQNAVIHQEDLGFAADLVLTYTFLHQTYDQINQADSAHHYIEKALLQVRDLNNKYTESKVLKEKALFLAKNHQPTDAFNTLLLSMQITDSINRVDNQQRMDLLENILDSEMQYYENSSLKDKFMAKLQSGPVACITLLLNILLIGLLVGLYFWWKKREAQLRNKEKTVEPYMSFLKKERVDFVRQKNDMQLQIDEQNRQLTSSALTLIKNDEFIQELSDELKQVLLELNPKDRNHRERIRSLLGKINSQSSQNNWHEFSYYFEKVHPSFYNILEKQFPTLTLKEKRLCSLLQLGLSSKEISAITYTEVRSVESARNRLRKKLGISTETNIVEFLHNLNASSSQITE